VENDSTTVSVELQHLQPVENWQLLLTLKISVLSIRERWSSSDPVAMHHTMFTFCSGITNRSNTHFSFLMILLDGDTARPSRSPQRVQGCDSDLLGDETCQYTQTQWYRHLLLVESRFLMMGSTYLRVCGRYVFQDRRIPSSLFKTKSCHLGLPFA
jgi:hypothetical protein